MTTPASGQPNDGATLQQRAFHGVRVLLGRQTAIRGMGLLGTLILARRLTAADYGWFAIAGFVVGVFSVFGDLGFSSYFIHVEKPPDARDIRVSFTTQVVFGTCIVTAIWIAAPWATHFYRDADLSTVWLIRVLALGVYLDVFRAFYRFQFERNLNYAPIARADVSEALFYQLVAITLALYGFHAWTLVLGLLASELAGTIILGIVAPAPARLLFDFRRMRELLPKTIRFQLYAPVNMLGETATPAIVGTLVGPIGVGFLGFASPQARRPIVIIEAVTRVSFPHFSRMKNQREALSEALVTYLIGFVWVVLFWAAGLTAAGGAAIEVIYGARWLPAVPALLVFAIALPLDSVSWLMGQAFSAMGRAMVPVYIVAFRSVLMLALTAGLVQSMGFIAMPVAYFTANLITAPLQLALFEKGLLALVLKRTAWIAIPALASVGVGRGCLMWVEHEDWHGPIIRMLVAGIPAVIAYLALSYVCLPRRYRPDLHRLLRQPLSIFRERERVRDELDAAD